MKKVLLSLVLLSLAFSKICLGKVTFVNKTGKDMHALVEYNTKPKPLFDEETQKLKNPIKNNAWQTVKSAVPVVKGVYFIDENGVTVFSSYISGVKELKEGATYNVTFDEKSLEEVDSQVSPEEGKRVVPIFIFKEVQVYPKNKVMADLIKKNKK